MTDNKVFYDLAEMAIAGIEGIKRTGIKVDELRERYGRMVMPLEGNAGHIGGMYAGSLFVIGEIAGGIIHLVSFDWNKFFPVVKEIKIRYRRPAMTDVILEVEMSAEEAERIQAEAEEKGKADFEMDLELKDANGEAVALVSGLWQIRKIAPGGKMSL